MMVVKKVIRYFHFGLNVIIIFIYFDRIELHYFYANEERDVTGYLSFVCASLL